MKEFLVVEPGEFHEMAKGLTEVSIHFTALCIAMLMIRL